MAARNTDMAFGGEITLAMFLLVNGALSMVGSIVLGSKAERTVSLVQGLWLLAVGALFPMRGVFWHYAALITFALLCVTWALAIAMGAAAVFGYIAAAYSLGAVVYLVATIGRKRRLYGT